MTIRVSDTFSVGVDTNLDVHTPTPTGDGWTEEVRTGNRYQRIRTADDYSQSNAGENSDRHIYTAQPNCSGAEYDVEAQLVGVPAGAGTDDPWFLVARLTGTGDYYSAGVYDNAPAADKKIFKTVGGTPTELASGAMSAEIADNDILMFEVRDATKKLYKNAGEELSTSNNDITASGRAGFGLGNAWVSTDDIVNAWDTDNFELDEVVGGGPTPQSVVATATGVAVVAKLPKKVIPVTATGTPVVSRGLTLYRTFAVAATGVVSVTRKMYETVSVTAVGLAVVARSKQFARAITATAVGVVAVSKLPKKVIAVIATGSAIVNRRLTLYRAISATAVGSASVVRKMYETVAATAIGIPLITRQLQFTKVITATAVGVVTQTKLVKKMVAVTALAIPLVVRKMFVAVAVTAVGVAVVDGVAKFFQVVAATAVGLAVVVTNYIPFVPGGVSAGRFIKWMGGFLGR